MLLKEMPQENSGLGAVETIRQVRLRELIAKEGLANLARKAGRQSAQLSSTSRGLRPFGERLARALEKELDLEEGYFDAVEQNGSDFTGPVSKMSFSSVPLVAQEDAATFKNDLDSKLVVLPFTDAKADFAIILRDAAMSPEFNQGDIAYFRKADKGEPGCCVLASVDGEILFRRFVSRSYKSYSLISVNKFFPDVNSDEANIQILAKLVAIYRKII